MYPHYLPTPKDDQNVIMYRAGQRGRWSSTSKQRYLIMCASAPSAPKIPEPEPLPVPKPLPAPKQAPPPLSRLQLLQLPC